MQSDIKVRQGASSSLGPTSTSSLPQIRESLIGRNSESLGNRKVTSALRIQENQLSVKKGLQGTRNALIGSSTNLK